MFTSHEDTIRDYDDDYDKQIGNANDDYNLSGADVVQTRIEAFTLAKETLAALYVEPFGHTATDIDEVYIDTGLNSIDRTPNNKPAGRDLIFGEGGGDEVHAGTMNDIVYGDYGSLALDIAGEAGNDTLYGDAGDDTLIGGAEADELPQGDTDADSLDGGGGSDVLRGGVGTDTLAGGTETGEPTYMNFDQLYGGDGVDHFTYWGSEQIWDAESFESFTIGGLTVTGGSWQFVGKEINENEEQGYVDTYGYVGSQGEIYNLSFVEIEGEFVLCLGIQIYDRQGEFTNDWETLQEVGIVGFENNVAFMGVNIEELNSFSAMSLLVDDLLGGNSIGQESAIINQSMANLFSRMELVGNAPPPAFQSLDAVLLPSDG